MRTIGIVCEYNPFHRGHAWQLTELRRRFGAESAVVCAMSGNFVQRGDFALLRKHARAEMAVRGGADLVVELPSGFATASAEAFAFGGVSVLQKTGVVDTLAFGSECGDLCALREVAAALLSPAFPGELQTALQGGAPFAAARETALAALIGAEKAGILRQANNILGVEYCKALTRLGGMEAVTLRRVGAAHDGETAEGIASASALRRLLLAGEDAGAYLPAESARIYEQERLAGRAPVSAANAERAILARFRAMSESDFAPYDEGGEGLYRRFAAAAATAPSIEELLRSVKTKRYAHARLRRMLLRAYLGLAERPTEIPYLRVLACGEKGRALLRQMRQTAAVPVLMKPAEARKLPPAARRMFEDESRCTDLYALAYPDLAQSGGGSEWSTGPVIV